MNKLLTVVWEIGIAVFSFSTFIFSWELFQRVSRRTVIISALVVGFRAIRFVGGSEAFAGFKERSPPDHLLLARACTKRHLEHSSGRSGIEIISFGVNIISQV